MHYTINDDFISNTYLDKLSNALDRKVKVFLLIDALMSRPNKAKVKELKKKGANIIFLKKTE